MKALLFTMIALLIFSAVRGQSDYAYQELLARASLCHLQKDYKKAINYYEKAFRMEHPDALTAYKAAGAYALDHNGDQAFGYLTEAIRSGWHEADMLLTDPYFDYLKNTSSQKFKNIVADALVAEKKYERGLKMPGLRKQINLMMLKDQRLRYARIQADGEEQEQKVNSEIRLADSLNRMQAKEILKKYGWPKLSDIGKDGQNNLWLLVQHADDDVIFQQHALSAMKVLKAKKELDLENYAYLYDRIQCNLNYKQLYGTQVNWSSHGQAESFRSIINEDSVDHRRKCMDMLPLRIYALTYGFEYKNVNASKARKADSADRAYTRALIDSAKKFYAKSAFQKVYDYYNRASMIAGGMSDADNFDAALIFAVVAAKVADAKYKSISLDFLNLLYLRNKLRKQQLSGDVFKVLHQDDRWLDMYSHIN